MGRTADTKRRKTRRTYRHGYTPEFRLRVVQEVIEKHLTAYSVARVFGITHTTMANWLRRYRAHGEAGLGIKKPGPRPRGRSLARRATRSSR